MQKLKLDILFFRAHIVYILHNFVCFIAHCLSERYMILSNKIKKELDYIERGTENEDNKTWRNS